MAAASEADDAHALIRDRLLDATERSILAVGVQKTRVERIAADVGLLRPNVYRYVAGGKEGLILGVLLRDADRIHAARRRRLPLRGRFDRLLVESLVLGSQNSRDSPVFRVCIDEDAQLTARLLTRGAAVERAQAYWFPILAYGRGRGELRESLSDEHIVRWFLAVQFLLHEHEEFFGGAQGVREYITALVVPAVANTTT